MPAAELPPPTGTPYRIGLVCLGNICRSPMADVVLSELVDRAGLAAEVEVSSSGTGGWHVGQPMDPRAAATLVANDYDPSRHLAQQFDAAWSDRDLVLAMDSGNLTEVRAQLSDRAAHGAGRLRMFRDFDPVGAGDVPDPYYGGADGFAEVLRMVERTSIAIVEQLERHLH
ncbi:MAG: low molecular weight protein-tyrosine-phosphatase [Marmoricola sp.]